MFMKSNYIKQYSSSEYKYIIKVNNNLNYVYIIRKIITLLYIYTHLYFGMYMYGIYWWVKQYKYTTTCLG